MLTYSLSDTGKDSLYLYLYKCIKKDILNGVLPSGTKLPSKRSFAKNLGVSNITVENSYALLQSEGYIFSLPKRGFFVSDIMLPTLPGVSQTEPRFATVPTNQDPLAPPGASQTEAWFAAVPANQAPLTLPSALQTESQTAPEFQISPISPRKSQAETDLEAPKKAPQIPPDSAPPSLPPIFADFVNNHTTPESFPFSIWAKLLRETISRNSNELMTPPPCGGIFELRAAICAHLKQFRGMQIHPEQIIIGAGTDYLYSMLILLLGRDKIYAIENPGYTKIEKVYRTNGVDCRFVGMDACGIKIEDLNRHDADIVHISPSHHYPTGIVTPVSRRYELLGWAAARPSRYIIEDDYDSEFRFAAHPMPTLQSIDAMENVIYINTFTKSLASTIRISYMVLPPHLLQRFYAEFSFYSNTVSNFEQYTLAKFIRDGYFEKHINRMRNDYRAVRDALLLEIEASPLAARCTIAEESAGLHFILRVETALSEPELIKNARMHGLHISCLSQYYHTDSAGDKEKKLALQRAPFTHALVMNYSGLRKEDIKEAVRRLCESIPAAS